MFWGSWIQLILISLYGKYSSDTWLWTIGVSEQFCNDQKIHNHQVRLYQIKLKVTARKIPKGELRKCLPAHMWCTVSRVHTKILAKYVCNVRVSSYFWAGQTPHTCDHTFCPFLRKNDLYSWFFITCLL